MVRENKFRWQGLKVRTIELYVIGTKHHVEMSHFSSMFMVETGWVSGHDNQVSLYNDICKYKQKYHRQTYLSEDFLYY